MSSTRKIIINSKRFAGCSKLFLNKISGLFLCWTIITHTHESIHIHLCTYTFFFVCQRFQANCTYKTMNSILFVHFSFYESFLDSSQLFVAVADMFVLLPSARDKLTKRKIFRYLIFSTRVASV